MYINGAQSFQNSVLNPALSLFVSDWQPIYTQLWYHHSSPINLFTSFKRGFLEHSESFPDHLTVGGHSQKEKDHL